MGETRRLDCWYVSMVLLVPIVVAAAYGCSDWLNAVVTIIACGYADPSTRLITDSSCRMLRWSEHGAHHRLLYQLLRLVRARGSGQHLCSSGSLIRARGSSQTLGAIVAIEGQRPTKQDMHKTKQAS